MFAIAIFIELYAYIIFGIGLAGQLKTFIVFTASAILAILGSWYFFKKSQPGKTLKKIKLEVQNLTGSRLTLLFLFLLGSQALINLLGALSPEIAFDALWYHLTIPKIYIQNESIHFIPGGLFYYSTMPKMIDLLYVPALMFGNEITAKLIHFTLGALTTISIYIFARKFSSPKIASLASLVFYSNLVVAWQSTTAYIDLGRTLFEFLALCAFVNFQKTKAKKWLFESGIMAGAAISTKWLAATNLVIFFVLFLLQKSKFIQKIKNILLFSAIAIFVVLPSLIFSFVNTNNPFYPIFSPYYSVIYTLDAFSILNVLKDLVSIFLFASDPISPIYLVALPLILLNIKKFNKSEKTILYYSLLSLVLWYLTPKTGGGRFIMPYLPAFSVLVALSINKLSNTFYKKFLIICVVVISVTTIIYRGIATIKYVPYLSGKETKKEFLTKNLNFTFGDFYDTDNYFSENITEKDTVLVYGIHNLYYTNFPYIHESYIESGQSFNYILVGQSSELPQRFSDWNKIYQNDITGVKLYSKGGIMWQY